MRLVFVLPAVVIPLTLVLLAAVLRRVGEAVADLRRELVASRGLGRDAVSLVDDLDHLARRSGRPRSRSIEPRQ